MHSQESRSTSNARRAATAVFTIVANNYLHFARTLLRSVRDAEPGVDCHCVLVDRDPALAAELADEIRFLHLEELGVPGGEAFAFQYPVMELCTAVKPWAIGRLLDLGYERVIYLDPDIFVYRPLDRVHALLEQGANLVLTPHLLAPVSDARKPGELEIRQSGAYNLGFCAFRACAGSRALLVWWQSKLARQCVVDLRNGVFVDQSWMDLVPGLFANVAILRHPGYNVAYWNLAQRPIARNDQGRWTAGGEPLVFFHFSGFDPERPEGFSRHQDRFTLAHLGLAGELVAGYGERLIANGAARYAREPFGYGAFKDGTPVPSSFRRLYRHSERVRESLGADPFARPDALQMPASAFGVQWMYERRERMEYPLLSGFSPVETNAAEEGVWASKRVSVYFCGDACGSVQVRGAYFPQPIEMASGRRDNTLSFWCGPHMFYQHTLIEPGDFEISTALPAGCSLAGEMLRIESSGSFVPSEIGINAHDPRNLAWRVKYLAVGALAVVDCNRSPVLLAADDSAAIRGVNLVAYIKAESGVGEAARCWAKAASAACIPYSLLDVGYQNPNPQRDASVVAAAVGETFDVDLLYVNADQSLATLAYVGRVKPPARITIGFWHWEQPELPLRYMGAFDGLTEVWTPSAFVHDAVARVSPIPVFKVPHAIEFSVSPGSGRAAFGLPADRFLVLVMYDFHSYVQRKNPLAAIEAFARAFPGKSGATLVLKTVNADNYAHDYAMLKTAIDSRFEVVCIDRFLTRQEIFDLENCCDCMLSLHRAEGFGLGLAEMMYLGKPVVATGWSGNMEFMTPMNSFPVEYELKKLAGADGAYEAGQEWAEADIGHAAACLRRLVDDAALVREVGARGAATMRDQFSPLAIGKRYRKRLSHLAWALTDAST